MNSIVRASKILSKSRHIGAIMANKPMIEGTNLSQTLRRFHPAVRVSNTVKVTYIDPMGDEKTVDAEVGKNLLDIAHDHNIELEGACGGGKFS
jgi:hypothetical protein